MSIVEAPLLTTADLLAMPDGDFYELVAGQLVERKTGMESSFVAGEIFGQIRDWNRQVPRGIAFPEGTGFRCFTDDPEKVRRPDVSFLRFGKLPNDRVPKGWGRTPPDLVVEVVSPRDSFYEVEEKVDEWLAAGVPLVWVANPATGAVSVRRADGSLANVRGEQEITGEDVLPGFRCRVADFFRVPASRP